MLDAKAEAKRFFAIRFPPMRYGQDNREIAAHPDTREITDSLGSLKGFSASVGKRVYEASLCPHESFVDVLSSLSSKGLKAKIEPLVLIDYFVAFGNQRELLRILDAFDRLKQGDAKELDRGSIDGTPLEETVRKFSTWTTKAGTEAKRYKLTNARSLLKEIESAIYGLKLPDLSIVQKIHYYNEITGLPYISGLESDRKKLFVREVMPVKRKSDGKQFGYGVCTQSIGSGVEARFTVFNRVFDKDPIQKGDVILLKDFTREGKYFTLTAYSHLEEN